MALLTSSWYGDVLAASIFLLAALVFYFKRKYGYWRRKGVPYFPATIPFGNAGEIVMQKVAFGPGIINIYNRFKKLGVKYGGHYFFHKPVLFVLDPELIKGIMAKDFSHFVDHANYVNEEVDPLSGHLFSLRGQKWKNLRVKLTPTFTSGKMKMMFQILIDCSDELIVLLNKSVKENSAVDIKDLMARFTTDIIGSCAFGIECNSLKNPNSEFREYGKKVFEVDFLTQIKNLVSLVSPEILDFFKVGITRRDVSDFFMNMVEETVGYREKNNVVRKDFMHLLIQLKNNVNIKDQDHDHDSLGKVSNGNTPANQSKDDPEPGTTLNIKELAAQAFVFFLAGFETSSTTLTFLFYELVTNLRIQEKLREEIHEVLEKHNGKITYDALMDMHYMQRCIEEALRKYPPVPVLTRECTETYKMPDSDLVVEKGQAVFIPILGIQHDPEHYPDPEKFDPDRFTNEAKAARHPFTWLPFGEGPRICIGSRFGLMQTKVALSVLLRDYKFTLNSKTKTPLVMEPRSFILSVKDGVWLSVEKI